MRKKKRVTCTDAPKYHKEKKQTFFIGSDFLKRYHHEKPSVLGEIFVSITSNTFSH